MAEVQSLLSVLTYPAPFLLRDVEVVEEKERSEVWLGLEEAGVYVVGAVGVVHMVRVVTVVVVGGVLQLVKDDAGGGDTRPLQEADTVDQEGAGHLPHQRASPLLCLATVFLHPEGVMVWAY